MSATVRGLAFVAVLALGACGKSDAPPAAPAPASTAGDRVGNVDKLPAAAQPAATTLNAAGHVDDTLNAQKEALDRKVEEQTK